MSGGTFPRLGPGRSTEDVLSHMESLRANDVRWRDGRAFSLAYSAGPDVLALAEEAYRRFSGENALSTSAFPSLRTMAAEVVDVVAGWLHGTEDVSGFMTSGGTESLLLAVRSARVRAEREGKVLAPYNMVLPMSAHAALEKAADYFGVESRRIPVDGSWRADVAAMSAAVDEHTILLVASAPQYPQGVIDPVASLAPLAIAHGLNFHVDACMGGVVLPFLEDEGESIPVWDFRVEGVTSISVDLHKYGYTSKGAGVLLHRNKTLRSHQTFVTDNWLGGVYGSSGILGTKSGGPIASAWAVMNHLGDDGYRRLAKSARTSALRIAEFVDGHPDLKCVAVPDSTLVCVAARDDSLDVFAVADALIRRGWYVDKQGPPRSIHLTVNAVHDPLVDEFCSALGDAVVEARGSSGTSGAYASVE